LAKNPFYNPVAKNPFYHNPNTGPAYHPKAQAPKAAAAPPAAQPGTNALPFNATSQANIAAANNNFNIQDLGPGGFQSQLQQLDFDYNSPLNPFNRAAMMQRSYQQGVSRNTNSYAARGQLYAGSLQNAQNAANFGYQQSSASAQQAYQNARNRILQSRALAQQGVTNTTAINNASAIDAALANPGA